METNERTVMSGVPEPAAVARPRSSCRDAELAAGRTCYRHLAGRLGVGLTDAWNAAGFVTDDWHVTDAGRAWFVGRGVDTEPVTHRPLLRPCIDWTERRPHAAGVLADRLVTVAFRRGWIVRGAHRRSIHVTPAGEKNLRVP